MEEVKTDLLVDIEDGDANTMTDLPLNLKSAGSISRNITSSLSTPGSLYTSGTSEGILTSAKTKSRLSSIFLKRPTILSDDDPFDLAPNKSKIDNSKGSFNTPNSSKGVRTGVLVSIGEDSNGETIDGTSTDWDSLKFEANAIIGDIQLSSRKAKSVKFAPDERKKFNFSLLSPINNEETGCSILNFSDSDDNSDNEWKSHEKLNSSIASPVKLLEFSGCDVSNIDAERTTLDYLNLSTNDIANRLSVMNLKQEELRPSFNFDNKGKENLLDMQHLPDLVINTHHKILNDIKRNPDNTEKKVLKFTESIRRHSMFPKSGVDDPAVLYATPARTSKTVFKKPNENATSNKATTKSNVTNNRAPLATTFKHNSNSIAISSDETMNKNAKSDKLRRQSHIPSNRILPPARASNNNAKKLPSFPKTSTASKPEYKNPIKTTSNMNKKSDITDSVKHNIENKAKQSTTANTKSKVSAYSYARTRGNFKSANSIPQDPKTFAKMKYDKSKQIVSASQKHISNIKAEHSQKTNQPSEKNMIQSSTYNLTDAIAEFNSRGKVGRFRFLPNQN